MLLSKLLSPAKFDLIKKILMIKRVISGFFLMLIIYIMFQLFGKMFGQKTDFKALMAKKAVIVDVRSKGEFAGGHIQGSENIPLDELSGKINYLKERKVPIITVCASGMRSGLAKNTLSSAGVEAYNGGAWSSLEAEIR